MSKPKKSILSRGAVKLIKIYQITPIGTHSQCKFIPSCSNYAIDALETYGFFKGGYLAFKRILRCNPFNKGGIDYLKK